MKWLTLILFAIFLGGILCDGIINYSIEPLIPRFKKKPDEPYALSASFAFLHCYLYISASCDFFRNEMNSKFVPEYRPSNLNPEALLRIQRYIDNSTDSSLLNSMTKMFTIDALMGYITTCNEELGYLIFDKFTECIIPPESNSRLSVNDFHVDTIPFMTMNKSNKLVFPHICIIIHAILSQSASCLRLRRHLISFKSRLDNFQSEWKNVPKSDICLTLIHSLEKSSNVNVWVDKELEILIGDHCSKDCNKALKLASVLGCTERMPYKASLSYTCVHALEQITKACDTDYNELDDGENELSYKQLTNREINKYKKNII